MSTTEVVYSGILAVIVAGEVTVEVRDVDNPLVLGVAASFRVYTLEVEATPASIID